MRMGKRSMPLIGAHVANGGAELLTPQDGVAAIAGMAVIQGIGHFGNVSGNEIRVAAIAIAGKDQGPAANGFPCPVRPGYLNTGNPVAVAQERCDRRIGDKREAGGFGGVQQSSHQRRAGLLRDRMHAVGAVAGIEEIIEHNPFQTMSVGEPFQCRTDGVHHAVDDFPVGAVPGLHLDVGGKPRRTVLDRLVLLEPCRRGGNEAGRHGGGPRSGRVPFDDDDIRMGVQGAQAGRQATGTGADDQHIARCIEGRTGCGTDRVHWIFSRSQGARARHRRS